MKSYQLARHFSPAPFFWLLGVAVVGGLLFGGIYYGAVHIGNYFLVYPWLAGGLGGAVLQRAIHMGKMRHQVLAAACGVVMGLVIYGSNFGFSYLEFRNAARETVRQQLQAQSAPVDPAALDAIVDRVLRRDTGASGFLGYLLLQAKQGAYVETYPGTGTNLGAAIWLLWLVEVGIVSGLAAVMSWMAAGEPFCETCNRWFGNTSQLLGGVRDSQTGQLIQWLKAGRFTEAGALLAQQMRAPCAAVFLESCPQCQTSHAVLTLRRLTVDSRGRARRAQLLRGVLSPFQRADLVRGMMAHRSAAAESSQAKP